MRAAIYTRVSTKEQAREGLSLALQAKMCEERARKDGAVTVEVFEDDGYSGTKASNRPALQRLLARLSDFDALYVYRQDRLGRNTAEVLQMVGDFIRSDVQLRSLNESVQLESPGGRAMFGVSSVFAEMEAALARERINDAMEELRAQGRHLGNPPFGYRRGKDKTAPMEPHPVEAPIVRELFARYAAGEPLKVLARWLNTEHREAARGKQWWTYTVSLILKQPAHVGMMHQKGKVVPGQQEPIVDEVTWRRVQQRIKDNARVPPSSRDRSLSPVFRCGPCGSYVRRSGSSVEATKVYQCVKRDLRPAEERHQRAEHYCRKVHAVTWAVVRLLLTEDSILDARRRQKDTRHTDKRKALAEERARLDYEVAYNLEAARAGAIDIALLAKQNAPLLARRDEVDRELTTEDEVTETLQGLGDATPEALIAALQNAGYEEQRRFLLRFFQRIEIHREFLRFVPTIADLEPVCVAIPARLTVDADTWRSIQVRLVTIDTPTQNGGVSGATGRKRGYCRS